MDVAIEYCSLYRPVLQSFSLLGYLISRRQPCKRTIEPPSQISDSVHSLLRLRQICHEIGKVYSASPTPYPKFHAVFSLGSTTGTPEA